MKKRILSILTALCLCLTLLPTAALAEGESNTAPTNKTLMLGTSGIKSPTAVTNDSGTYYTPNSYIYFGMNGETPIKWRVLDADKTNAKTTGMFLLSEYLLDSNVKFQATYHTADGGKKHKSESPDNDDHTNCVNANVYQGSDAQKWCFDFADNQDNFSTVEQGVMLGVTKTDEEKTLYNISWGTASLTENDKLFFLSAEELADHVGNYDGAPTLKNDNQIVCHWWLRSPKVSNASGNAGKVNDSDAENPYGNGEVYGSDVSQARTARPAFNLNLNNVLFTSAAVGGKSSTFSAINNYTGNEWKVTLKDESRSDFSAEIFITANGTIVSYKGATTGTNEYITAMVVNENNEVTYYGSLKNITESADASGIIEIDLAGKVDNGDKVYILNEQWNGDYKTDYASAFQTVTLTVDNTAPKLTAGTASRTSDTNATVTFTSDEAGTYYYTVGGDTAIPSIDTTGTGTACINGENTISLTDLATAGAKDIYIVAKDAAGNESTPLKITIPAYVAPVYSISADATTLDFGTAYTGYTAPAAKTITITNTGNQQITLTQPTATNFEIGMLSKTSLNPNETATFTVSPKSGLSVGTYNESISVQGANGGVSTNVLSITANFAVYNIPNSVIYIPSYSITTSDTTGNGSVTVSRKTAVSGTTITITVTPDEGYTLDTLTVLNQSGKEIELTDLGNGKYTFKMPAGKVTITATFVPEKTAADYFEDVLADSYYADALLWAVQNGITAGVDETHFAPDQSCTRAQLVTFLYRYVQSRGGGFTGAWMFQLPFSDVSEWCYESVAWSYMNGIIQGYGNGQFGSDDTITREQMAVILYRFAQFMGMDVSVGADTNILSYNDATDVSEYAVEAMQWATGAGILQGYDGNLMPKQPCTRAQIVTMLYRLLGA